MARPQCSDAPDWVKRHYRKNGRTAWRISDLTASARFTRHPSDRVIAKQLPRIDRHAANFIGMSPFCVLATSGPDGTVDASPRGGNPGFVRIENETRLLMPDRPGNNPHRQLPQPADRFGLCAIDLLRAGPR